MKNEELEIHSSGKHLRQSPTT